METNNYGYVTLMSSMLDLKLRGNEFIIYAIIYGMSMDGTSVFYGSLKYLEKWTSSSKQAVLDTLKRLLQRGLIQKEEVFENGIKYCRYWATITRQNTKEVVKNLDRGSQETLPGVVKNLDRGSQETLPNIKYINKDINNNNIYMCTECTDTKNNPSTPEKEEVKNTPSTTSKEPVTPSQPKKRTKKEFVKPTVEELQKYIDENSLKVDAQYFFKHYEIRNWTLGNGKKMQNWKQTLRTWDLNSERYGTGSKKTYGAGIHTISNQDNFDGEVNF